MNKFTIFLLPMLQGMYFGFLLLIFFLFGYAYGSGMMDTKETSNNTIVYLNNGTVQIDGKKITITGIRRDDRQD